MNCRGIGILLCAAAVLCGCSMQKDHVIIFSTHILQLATDLCDEIVILSDGRLRQIDHEMLKQKDFEEQIIELLKDEESHG